jgi:hypothetical protein
VRTKLPRWLGAVLVAGGLGAGLGACGGGGARPAGVAHIGTTSTTRVAPVSGGTAQAPGQLQPEIVKYSSCMRSHGVAGFPEPTVSGSSISLEVPRSVLNSPKFASASAACREYAPKKLAPQQITTADQAAYLKAAQCMRSHGIVGFPDPVFSNGNVSFPVPTGMSTNSPRFLRAREICEMLIPEGLPYSKEAEGGK